MDTRTVRSLRLHISVRIIDVSEGLYMLRVKLVAQKYSIANRCIANRSHVLSGCSASIALIAQYRIVAASDRSHVNNW